MTIEAGSAISQAEWDAKYIIIHVNDLVSEWEFPSVECFCYLLRKEV